MITRAILLLAVLLSGCATPPYTVEHVQVGGQSVEVHTNAATDPCPEAAAGCYDITGRRVFIRHPARQGTREHELAHAAGMMHDDWVYYEFNRMRCTTITIAGGGYTVGQVICLTWNTRTLYTDSTMSQIAWSKPL